MFTPRQAVDIVRHLEPRMAAIGCHVGLTGSVLFKGSSEKDIDLILYNHAPEEPVSDDTVYRTLTGAGFYITKNDGVDFYAQRRKVWMTTFRGMRVDIFLLLSPNN